MIGRDTSFVMLATDKRVNVFQNVGVGTFSSLLTAAPEPKRDCRNLAVEYRALP